MSKTRQPDLKTGKLQHAEGLVSLAQESRILILAPTGNDARLTVGFLTKAGLVPQICREVSQLCAEARKGCGAILLAEETLGASSVSLLWEALAQQPAWSDIPVTIITSGGEASQMHLRRLAIFGPGGNVTLLERPFHPGTLVSTLQVALRARQRQYETRDLVLAKEELMRQQEAQARLFDATLSSIADLAYTFDLAGNWIYANKPLLELWGKSLNEIVGKSSVELGYPVELAERLKRQVQEVIATRKALKGETYFTDAAGVEDYHEYIFSPVLAADGRVTAVCGTTRLTTERKRAEAVAESQRRVLQLIVEDAPLRQMLDELTRTVELQCSKKTFASVLLLDAEGVYLRHESAPSLPSAYREAIDGMAINPAVGSSIFPRQAVYVSNIATDPLWAQFRDVALRHGLRSCWSIPILSAAGGVLGVFAIYHTEPREANEMDLRVAEMAVRTASIAIERKLSDAAVLETQQRYSQLVHGLPTAVYTTDAQGRVILYNEAAADLWGRRPEVGKDLWCDSFRAYLPDGRPLPLDQSPMAVTLREGRPVRGEEIIIERSDGSRRNVLPHPDPIRDASGRIVGAVNMVLDITESKRAEEASRRLAAIVESSDDAIISKNLSGIITSWNRGAERLFGYRAEEMIGQPITILMPPEHVNEEPNILARIRRGERIENYETVRQRKDGSKVEISLTVSPIKDAGGRVIGASKIVRDITEKKQVERKLERAHRDAVTASQAKDEFLAALSHELRTPLNPVLLLASEAAEDTKLPAEVRNQFAAIRNNVELEARLIDDLLDITRISHGKLALSMGLIDVHAVLNEAMATVRSELDHKRIELAKALVAKHHMVKGDAVRLQQVFWNVIKNAIKFTPDEGKITISTHTEGAGELIVIVRDTGIGMSSGELEKVFEAFAQGEHFGSGGSRRFGGMGLGLAISRKLVELHEGMIRATSKGPNQGSTFIITLPLVPEHSPVDQLAGGDSSRQVPVDRRKGPIHILLVEDHEPTRTALARLLTSRGYVVKTAASVGEARALSGTQEFQMLISDIGLPDGDGLELMNELLGRNKDLQGIALTGYGMEEDVARSRAAGFGVHLTKPVRIQSLETALSTAVSQLP